MSEAYRAEFTGERVIPGSVEENLFNEHLARYRFTARLVRDLGLSGRFLDAGCGAGYGTAELAATGAEVLGIDVSADAVAHARANYSGNFEQASCTAIPADDGAFRVITAFEVIEHLPDWREFLSEARRVLDPAGLLLVSTPNRLYYAESREKAGPNPFHVHEFTADEFRAELSAVFPQVKLLLQNHVEGVAFSGAEADGAAVEISERRDDPDAAHFFLAICSGQPLPAITRFVFIPDAGNVLQTREHHIALLDGEIQKKNEWIEAEKAARARMIEKVAQLETELEDHNRWAKAANETAAQRAKMVADLQAELRKSNDWAAARNAEAEERGERIVALQAEIARATEWAHARDVEAEERGQRIVQLQDEIARATEWGRTRDAEVEERGQRIVVLQDEVAKATEWARSLDLEAGERGRRVIELQDELAREQATSVAALNDLREQLKSSSAGYEAAIEQWRRDKAASDRWAMTVSEELDAARDKLMELEIVKARLAQLESRMAMIAQSRWVKVGRVVRLGPEIVAEKQGR